MLYTNTTSVEIQVTKENDLFQELFLSGGKSEKYK